jgi:SOS-response transcriptional repressor LexA
MIREPEGTRLEIYQFVLAFIAAETWAPTYDEIMAGVGRSKSTVVQHLDALERDGLIERGTGHRMIRIPQEEPEQ